MKAPSNNRNFGGINTLKIDGVTFYDTIFTESGLYEVLDFLSGKKEAIFQEKGMKVYYLGMSDFIVEFENDSARDTYLEKHKSMIIKGEKTRQIPKNRGFFSLNSYSYLLLGAEYDFEENIEDTEYGYKGIIFDLDSFLKIQSAVKSGKGSVENLL